VQKNLDKQVGLLQGQIDGNITSWFDKGMPLPTFESFKDEDGNKIPDDDFEHNYLPAQDWINADNNETEEANKNRTKNQHLGDLYYDETTGYCYRW
jgi:hypothetical protein